MNKGSLLIEFMISVTIFTAAMASLSLLIFQSQESVVSSQLEIEAFDIAQSHLDKSAELLKEDFEFSSSSTTAVNGLFDVDISITPLDNFVKKITTTVSYVFQKRSFSLPLSRVVVNTEESEGQSSCRPSGDIPAWRDISMSAFDLGNDGELKKLQDVDMVGNFSYIVSNTNSLSDRDFFIVDHSDLSHPHIVSSLETGPGLVAIHVAGDYAYVGNTSINAQLQVIDISDRFNPYVAASYKLPGVYDDGTTIGNSIFYKAGKVYLGTQKSQIEELHVIDVSSPSAPVEIASHEIGNAVNDIFAFKDRVYVANPGAEDLKVFSLGGSDLDLISSYNAPGNLVNGKRLSLFLDNLYLGRTVGNDELYAFNASSSVISSIFHFPVKASIQGVIGYGNLLFLLLSKFDDGFIVYDISGPIPQRINSSQVSFPAVSVNFDCDKDRFVIVSDQTPIVSFIYPSL